MSNYFGPLEDTDDYSGFTSLWRSTQQVFEPPYLKPKGVVDPNQHMHERLPGEPIGGNLTPAARRDRRGPRRDLTGRPTGS